LKKLWLLLTGNMTLLQKLLIIAVSARSRHRQIGYKPC
jgi:hypothetical protein